MTGEEKLNQRYRGCLVGLAVGDALGVPLEFQPPGTFEPVEDMIGGGPFDLPPGYWTDDTSMALCLAESLVECRGFDPVDQMVRYMRWYRQGYLSSTGECFDIGNTVAQALHQFEKRQEPYCGSTAPNTAGNGSLMRLAPIPMFYRNKPVLAVALAAGSSRTTHATAEAIDACRFYTGLIIGALNGLTKDELLSPSFAEQVIKWSGGPWVENIREIAFGSYKEKEPPQIRGSGYVVESLEAALWAFYKGETFEEGLLLAVNLGDDADTTGAVYGQLAGAHHGLESIPQRWLNVLAKKGVIIAYANSLCKRI